MSHATTKQEMSKISQLQTLCKNHTILMVYEHILYRIVYVSVPGCGAVPVEHIKVLATEQLAAIDTRLNGAQATQYSHLLNIAYEGHNIETLQFGIDRMEAPNKVLEEQLKGLR